MPKTNGPMVGPGRIRPIEARWVITGELVLDSAAHLGNGEKGTAVDMALVRDRAEDKLLLSGASQAGGLRSYVLDRLVGYAAEETTTLKTVANLFGGARGDDEGGQSPLIVFDSIPSDAQSSEIRDGVAMKAETGLADDHKKFDLEVLPAGARFPIRFELLVADTTKEQDQLSLLVTALSGLEKGEIPIGARRSRGLGACHARHWRATRFDLQTKEGWMAWLSSKHEQPIPDSEAAKESIQQALKDAWPGLTLTDQPDKRKRLIIKAQLSLQGGLLVRSPGTGATDADVTHLSSGGQAVLPGTSLAGALRARALRIAWVVRNGKGDAEEWVKDVFGPRLVGTTNPDSRPHASRLKITEKPITESTRLRPNRIKIDRFTGGVVDGALFDEEPVYGGKVEVTLELRNPQPGETGLVLLLLKDLLTGDLPVGGTSSVGRGVLKGTANVTTNGKDCTLDPEKSADPKTVKDLNEEVQKFHTAESRKTELKKEEAV